MSVVLFILLTVPGHSPTMAMHDFANRDACAMASIDVLGAAPSNAQVTVKCIPMPTSSVLVIAKKEFRT